MRHHLHLKKIIPTAGGPYLVNSLMDSMGVLKQDALPLLQSQSLFPSVPQPVICSVETDCDCFLVENCISSYRELEYSPASSISTNFIKTNSRGSGFY